MTGCVVLTLLVLFAYFSASDANPSISTSTPTPCYGDVVTLVCHHPELASNPGRYLTTVPTWRENRVGITPSTGVYSATDTSEDLMNTTLNITITVDHFRNKSFNYSCFLVLAVPMGKLETSGVVTVDPVDQLPTPMNTAIFSNSTTAGLTVSFDPRCCNTAQLNVATTTSSSATTPVVLPVDSTDPTNTTIVITDVTESVCYTASIQSACRDNNLLEDSGVLVVNVNGPPEVTITTITDSTITLTWNTALRCFESEMFTFVVIWNEIGSGTSTNVTTSSSPYTISGLQPGTSYQISVQGVGGSGVVSGTTVLNVTTRLAETPTGGGAPTTDVAIVVAASVIILVAVVIAIILVVVRCLKTRVQGEYDTGSRAHEPNPPVFSNLFSGRLSRTCCAQVDFESGNLIPVAPPPVDPVTYAEPVAVGEKDTSVCSQTNDGETKPELPTIQQPRHNIEEFRSDVARALIAIGVDNVTTIETEGVPHFTAEYNGIHFVVTCVYTSFDVTLEDVGHVVEAKQVTGSTKCLLISNQSTIPSECLLTLEDAGCQFVPVSGYGEKGWKDRMVNKVKDVFPRVPNNNSKSEDLPTSEQVMNILSNGGSCTPSFELFAEVSRDRESPIGMRENGGGAVSFQEPLPRRKGSKDGAQDIGESNLTEFNKKFVSKTCKNLDKVSVLKRTIPGAGLVLIGTLILCGPASPESHLGMKTPDSHLGMKTYQPMWKLDITCYQDGNKTEQVPLSQYVIAFSEQDIQNEANLEHLLNPLLSMILQEGTMLCRLSAPRLQSTDSKDTTDDASLPKLSVQ